MVIGLGKGATRSLDYGSKFVRGVLGCRGLGLRGLYTYSRSFLQKLMDMGYLSENILGTTVNYKRDPMFSLRGPLVRRI